MDTGFLIEITYWTLGILLAVYLGIRVQKKMTARVKKAKADLDKNGYVVDRAIMRPIGDLTRIWSRYSQPVGLYVQASNIDPIAIAAGNMGIADIKLGNPLFDSSFVVRSNEPTLVRMVFTAELQAILIKHPNIRFRTGSIDSLLGADYFPEIKNGRDLRNIWMLEKAGVLNEAECEELLKIGKNLAQKVEELSSSSKGSVKTSFFEGR